MMDFFGFTSVAPSPCVCAVGTFDGVHIGHRALLVRASDAAARKKLAFGVVLIYRMGECISTLEDRLSVIRSVGADFAFVYRLSDIMDMPCADFISRIKDECMTRYCVCGYNFRFGAGASGDATTLDMLIGADIMPPFEYGGTPVSSTRIRALIKKGEMKSACELLGRPYTVCGSVTHGRGVGRELGSPTANICLDGNIILPANGVYISDISFENTTFRAVTNIGVRPTFDSGGITVESYIPDFSGDLYGKKIKLALLKMLRTEIKFDTPQALSEQIKEDVHEALIYKGADI